MKTILFLFFYLFPFFILHSQTDSSFYFPMKTGNLWQYKEPPPPDDPYIIEIRTGRDTIFSNGQTYRSFVTKNYGFSDTIGTVKYERQIGNRVYRYFPNQQQEFLIYDFSKNIGDTVSVFNNPSQFGSDTSIVTVLDTGTHNIFGIFRKYTTFYNRLLHATLFWIDEITDGIGITSSETEPGLQLYLVGSIIDSVRYGVVTSVGVTRKNIPKDFTLFQNYPNPFNPTTTIAFKVPSGKQISLILYNVLGERIRILYAGVGNGNIQKIIWDGNNGTGIRVNSGAYFYQIRSEGFSTTKKLLLVQ